MDLLNSCLVVRAHQLPEVDEELLEHLGVELVQQRVDSHHQRRAV